MTAPIDGSGTDRARCVLAPNPGLMTLDGTNTWLVAEPGSATAVVIDPGPEDEGHLRRVVAVAERAGQRIAAIVLTHGHDDHSGGAKRLAGLTGAGVRAVDPAQRLGTEGLPPSAVVTDGGCEIEVLPTPSGAAPPSSPTTAAWLTTSARWTGSGPWPMPLSCALCSRVTARCSPARG